MLKRIPTLIVGAAAGLAFGPCAAAAPPPDGPAAQGSRAPKTVATGLQIPWGLAFLPNGDALVSERGTAAIKRIPARGGRARTVKRLAAVRHDADEGGLLGIAVSPAFRRDRLVYAYYTARNDNRVVRFRLGGRPVPIVTGIPRAEIHNGGRIAFGPDGKLYIGTGDAGFTDLAQDRSSLGGKILRVNPNGTVPADNPFPGSPVWSLGHRNVQGLAWDRGGRLWATEFGQDRRDEINLIRPGRNYGWPLVEGVGSTSGGRFTNPLVTWSTAEASPSGAAIVGRTLYVAALRGTRLWRVPLRGARVGRPTATLLGTYGRLRTVARAPDGSLWVATSNRDGRGVPRRGDDRIIRLTVGARR